MNSVCPNVCHNLRKAGLTQAKVATWLGRHQSFVATVKLRQRRIDVIELIDFATTPELSLRAKVFTLEM
jgi:hypothetical protein